MSGARGEDSPNDFTAIDLTDQPTRNEMPAPYESKTSKLHLKKAWKFWVGLLLSIVVILILAVVMYVVVKESKKKPDQSTAIGAASGGDNGKGGGRGGRGGEGREGRPGSGGSRGFGDKQLCWNTRYSLTIGSNTGNMLLDGGVALPGLMIDFDYSIDERDFGKIHDLYSSPQKLREVLQVVFTATTLSTLANFTFEDWVTDTKKVGERVVLANVEEAETHYALVLGATFKWMWDAEPSNNTEVKKICQTGGAIATMAAADNSIVTKINDQICPQACPTKKTPCMTVTPAPQFAQRPPDPALPTIECLEEAVDNECAIFQSTLNLNVKDVSPSPDSTTMYDNTPPPTNIDNVDDTPRDGTDFAVQPTKEYVMDMIGDYDESFPNYADSDPEMWAGGGPGEYMDGAGFDSAEDPYYDRWDNVADGTDSLGDPMATRPKILTQQTSMSDDEGGAAEPVPVSNDDDFSIQVGLLYSADCEQGARSSETLAYMSGPLQNLATQGLSRTEILTRPRSIVNTIKSTLTAALAGRGKLHSVYLTKVQPSDNFLRQQLSQLADKVQMEMDVVSAVQQTGSELPAGADACALPALSQCPTVFFVANPSAVKPVDEGQA
eukprot:TRINITY_DN63751_c0_g1_i1.p1 TRINITY_DN63751_c0_g1~~TRINITY_DN63751_c0_g1_i1.p1  ORF type:complete len:609 (+),score=72.23 TRINITY_DN63751_c0_g1_i1:31-1857(+)